MRHHVFIGDFTGYQSEGRSWQRLKQQCDSYLTMEVPVVHPRASITYMGLYILNLALMYRLSDEPRYLACVRRWMQAVCSYEHWGSDKKTEDIDLSASWVLFGLSLGYDWLDEELDQDERDTIMAKIERHAGLLHAYKLATEGRSWSTEYWQNHNWINMTGLAAAGYVLNAHGRDGTAYVESARSNFAIVYPALAEDGSDYEGVAYWRYGAMWLFVYAWLAQVEEGASWFETCPFLRETFWFRLYHSAPDMACHLNFGDAHDRYSSHPVCVYRLVARMYRNGQAQWLADKVVDDLLQQEASCSKVRPGILPEAGLEFIWHDPQVGASCVDNLPLLRHFPDLGLVVVKDGWGPDSAVLAFKCGQPGGTKQWQAGWPLWRKRGWKCMSLSHHHPDNLSYLLVRGEKFFTCEDGYNRTVAARHHNVLLVDGQLTDVEGVSDAYMASCMARLAIDDSYEPDRDYLGTLNYVRHDGGMVWFCGQTTGIYPQRLGMKRVERFVFSDGLRITVMIDRFESLHEHEYAIVCNTDEAPRLLAEGHYLFPDSTMRYQVACDCPMVHESSSETITSIMTPQEPDKLAVTTMQHLIHHTRGHVAHCMFVEVFSPAELPVRLRVSDSVALVETDRTIYRFKEAVPAHRSFEVEQDGIVRRYPLAEGCDV